jgi:DEAD/DEAH box helicase domain-containing protein
LLSNSDHGISIKRSQFYDVIDLSDESLDAGSTEELGILDSEKIQEIAIYDGDTPPYQRAAIREMAVLFSQIDMFHTECFLFILVARFFENLKLVVLDEAHIYRGVFGAHTANVIRRLIRVHKHYTQSSLSPQFTSVGNFIKRQTVGREIGRLRSDRIFSRYFGNGVREILFLNPPIVDEGFIFEPVLSILRKSRGNNGTENRQVLLFCQSRHRSNLLCED